MFPMPALPVTGPRIGVVVWTVVCAIAVWIVTPPRIAVATPLYAAREGRTCDNCHLRPNNWVNPPVFDRKCTMSCASCHVDPAGGGMRNAAGRFFGSATLPMIATNPRPTQDWDSWIGGILYRRDRRTTFNDSLPEGPVNVVASHERRFAPSDAWAKGSPAGGPSMHAPFQGRYAALNADPLFRISWDARVALLVSRSAFFFPMQADVAAALHPVEHVTLLTNVGARGRSTGASDTFNDPRTPYLREGFVLLHEAPANLYAKAGRFVPQFGLRVEDHTAQHRRAFEQDGSVPDVRVTGVEVGANPNYPFLSAAWFRSTSQGRVPSSFDIFDTDQGTGVALNLGYRETGWSLGGSALLHRRPVIEGGDATSYALYGSFNPWFYRRSLPLTYQAEYDYGRFQRASGLETKRAGFWHELDWRAGNGVDLLFSQDWVDPDTEVLDDHAFRVGAGIQITPLPGVTLDTRVRALFPAAGSSGADVFTQIHFWK
jgi:hypothetical protein